MKTMKMNKWAVACGLLAIAGLASAAIPVLPDNAPMTSTLLAKHGADDTVPEPDECDREDRCVTGAAGAILAKHGADDTVPEPDECDREDRCVTGVAGAMLAKHGADDTIPEPVDEDEWMNAPAKTVA